jgi:hypothetical protein
MNGLDLESFLLLLRADLGAWAVLAVGTLVLCLLVWLSWGSRRAMRKCLALSIVAHAGLALYGSTIPSVFRTLRAGRNDPREGQHIRTIRVTPTAEAIAERAGPQHPSPSPAASRVNPATATRLSPDLVIKPRRLADARLVPAHAATRGPADPAEPGPTPGAKREPLTLPTVIPQAGPLPIARVPEPKPRETGSPPGLPSPGPAPAPSTAELAQLVPQVEKLKESQGSRSVVPAMTLTGLATTDLRRESLRELRPRGPTIRPGGETGSRPTVAAVPLPRATPTSGPGAGTPAPLADLGGAAAVRSLTEVPQIYRSRLDANRSARAQGSGASLASEQAVERSLDWLARHQDADGRWDGATMRYEDGTAVPGDDDFTAFCPAGETCFGECAYWEADTGLTGLALLAYLGAGYTHTEGKYRTTLTKGIDFLLGQQKADGDLRGSSKAVGMYCHAMAALALCEAYALSLDERLREPAERAVLFLVRARARDGEAWRYTPGATTGDTSILGWVVMVFKSAREIGLRVPGQADVARGALRWLDRVAAGDGRGLARYQPWESVTPTMTAEAWVCRQFLGVGGPSASSAEAAASLLRHESDRGDTNFYYWYYGTLAMYQYGGPSWARWNERVRDRLVSLQRGSGHIAGSWDPDDSLYGARGGRIYCTALATLTLEVYYRYLRLYDEPNLPAVGQAPPADPPLEAPRLGPR